ELRNRVRKRMSEEEELLVDPRFFAELARHVPRLSGVSTRLKRGGADNELTRFRYDVVLDVEGPAPADIDEQRVDWLQQSLSVEALRPLLATAPDRLVVERIPNARLASIVRDMAAIGA